MNRSNDSRPALIIQIEDNTNNKFQNDFNHYLIASNVIQIFLYILAAVIAFSCFYCQRHKICQRFRKLKKYDLNLNLRQSIKTETQSAEEKTQYSPPKVAVNAIAM